jgi:hypothetical protein
MTIATKELLEHALVGYEARRAEVEQKIAEIRLRLRGNQAAEAPRRRRVLSPEGRARIIAATKRRWAKARRFKRPGDKIGHWAWHTSTGGGDISRSVDVRGSRGL